MIHCNSKKAAHSMQATFSLVKQLRVSDDLPSMKEGRPGFAAGGPLKEGWVYPPGLFFSLPTCKKLKVFEGNMKLGEEELNQHFQFQRRA